jgi:hypothetical protein
MSSVWDSRNVLATQAGYQPQHPERTCRERPALMEGSKRLGSLDILMSHQEIQQPRRTVSRQCQSSVEAVSGHYQRACRQNRGARSDCEIAGQIERQADPAISGQNEWQMTLNRYFRNKNESGRRRREYCVEVEVDLDLEKGLAVMETQRQDPFCCVII